MKLICDVCGAQYYTQKDPHDIGELRVCSDACMWELSNNGEPKPEKVVEEVFIAGVIEDSAFPHEDLYETDFKHGHYQSTIFTATPFRRCVVRIRIEKLRDLEEDE